MRRGASGGGDWGAGAVSSSGAGRLVFRVMVGDEGDDLVGAQFLAAAEVGELYEEGHAGDRAPGVLDHLAHGAGVYGRVQGAAVLYKGGYVLEGDARPREVGDGADVVLQFPGGFLSSRHGAKVSITFAIISSLMRESTVARWRALFMD